MYIYIVSSLFCVFLSRFKIKVCYCKAKIFLYVFNLMHLLVKREREKRKRWKNLQQNVLYWNCFFCYIEIKLENIFLFFYVFNKQKVVLLLHVQNTWFIYVHNILYALHCFSMCICLCILWKLLKENTNANMQFYMQF